MPTSLPSRIVRRAAPLVLVLLAIEFLDEFVYGAGQAAWPLIRDDLRLTYAQIGVLLTLPKLVGNAVEPFLGVLGDIWRRRPLILTGGALFALALLLTAASDRYALLLFSFVLLNPSSGAFVSLSQATLMDHDPARHEQNMARWTLAGSVGVVAGPLLLGGATLVGLGWRSAFIAIAGVTVVFWLLAFRLLHPTAPRHRDAQAGSEEGAGRPTLWVGLQGALRAVRRGTVVRWLALLQCSDLSMDILGGYLALYFVDVAGMSPAQAGLAVAVRAGVGLLGDVLVISLLERVRGLRYLRWTVLAELALMPLFLLVPGYWPKLALLALVTLAVSGWYAILQAQLYSAMPGQSGTAMAVGNIGGLFGALIPLGLGLVAQRFGLTVALWLTLFGPLALLVGLPRRSAAS